MPRMRDRNKFPPGGWRFIQPQVPRWSITPWVSFDTAVQQTIQMRQANPLISANNGLSLDPQVVANEIDEYNARICAEMRWNDFIWEGGGPAQPVPFPRLSQLKQSALRVAAGVEAIKEWRITGELVPQELAEKRSATCVACSLNTAGDLTSWFTVPAAEVIKKELEERNQLKIRTANDPVLGVCSACACPLKLKVHCPLPIINDKMRPEDRDKLDPKCWILKETNENSSDNIGTTEPSRGQLPSASTSS